ncbi:MAG: restriction endonuclease subunit S [Iamia sp.]
MSDVRLRHVASLVTDAPSGDVLPYLALEHVEGGVGLLVPGTELELRVPTDAGMVELKPGDVCFGKLRPYLAKSIRAIERCLASTELVGMRASSQVDSRWLRYQVMSTPFVEWAVATSEGTKMPRTSWESMSDFRLSPPSLEAQRVIADHLDAETARIDALITKRQRQIELLDERFRSRVRGLVALGSRIPIRRITLRTKTGATPPGDVAESLKGGDVEWISPGDIGGFCRVERASRHLAGRAVSGGWCPPFPAGSTAVVGVGATAGRVGHLDRDATGNQQITALVPNERILPRFLSWQLWVREADLRAEASATTLPLITNDQLRSMAVFVPTLDRQRSAVADVGRLESERSAMQRLLLRHIELARERRQALITAAVTGELAIA